LAGGSPSIEKAILFLMDSNVIPDSQHNVTTERCSNRERSLAVHGDSVANILELCSIYNLRCAICHKPVIPNRMNMQKIVASEAAAHPHSPLRAYQSLA